MDPAFTALVIALVWDELRVEWPNAVHPVAWHGRLVSGGESVLFRESQGRGTQFLGGAVLVALVGVALPLGLAWSIEAINVTWLRVGVESVALASTFTITGLIRAARQLGHALRQGDLGAARHELRSLCSRDSSLASSSQLIAAGIESVAENTSDSYVAPLVWYLVLGLPGALVYRACNTLDAMIGYRGRYEYFGKVAARMDDLLNIVPARLTAALFLVVKGPTLGRVVIWWRDSKKTASPNAGHPMAMMAALLGVELEKPGHYRLGAATRPIAVLDLDAACVIARRSAYVVALLSLGVTWLR